MKVFAYRNLNRKGVVWSVKSCKTGLVIDRSPYLIFEDVELKVSKAGKKRVIEQKRKNVHAGVKGVLISKEPNVKWVRAKYNPYTQDTFQLEDGSPVLNAKYAKLTENGLFISF